VGRSAGAKDEPSSYEESEYVDGQESRSAEDVNGEYSEEREETEVYEDGETPVEEDSVEQSYGSEQSLEYQNQNARDLPPEEYTDDDGAPLEHGNESEYDIAVDEDDESIEQATSDREGIRMDSGAVDERTSRLR
jgi:hypothetical protein